MAATEPIRDKEQLKRLAEYFLERGQYRDYVMIVMDTCTALRISDILPFTWDDVYDERCGVFRTRVTIIEKKTGKIKPIALNEQVIHALRIYLPHRRSRFIFANNRKDSKPISRMQAWRIVREAVTALSITGKISCHSLRKSWGYHAWTSGGVSPVVIMEIYNHSSYEITRRYLGVAQDDLDRAYLGMSLF
ncbi:MAG: tyrosine-type recombinase/integrase [Candidatus Saccharimonadales bacterium]